MGRPIAVNPMSCGSTCIQNSPDPNLTRDAARRELGTKRALGIPPEHLNLRMGLRFELI